MKSFIFLLALFFLFGCISQYEPVGIAEMDGILVVEGHITDYESLIGLSRSRLLSNREWTTDYVFGARVYVEREDGTLFPAVPPDPNVHLPRDPRYVISKGKLDTNSRYRLRIGIGNYQYFSEFSYPIITPEIDSIFWRKRDRIDQWNFPQPIISIHVATHSPDRQVMFYRWSFREDWEINAPLPHPTFPSRCWDFHNSSELLFGSAERTIEGRVIHQIRELSRRDSRFSGLLYRITVTQNAISRDAHRYFENLRRNIEQTGSIFSPTPAILRGNIYNATDPNRHVVGFIDVSTTTRSRLYISRWDGAYIGDSMSCVPRIRTAIPEWEWNAFPHFEYVPGGFVRLTCVSCRALGDNLTTEKPNDWPF